MLMGDRDLNLIYQMSDLRFGWPIELRPDVPKLRAELKI